MEVGVLGFDCVAWSLSLSPPSRSERLPWRSAEGPPPLHIAFVGNSMADGLWGAMFRRLGKDKCLADKVKLIRRAKNGSGLTRLDQYNWVDEVGAIATDPGADLFVGSFGVNDRQSIVDVDKKRTEFGGPDYDGRYEGIVEDVVQSRPVARLVLSGDGAAGHARSPPPTPTPPPRTSCSPTAVAQVASPRAAFVAPWTSQPPPDAYKPFLPNAKQTLVQVRAPDGVHFTTAGYDMVMEAFYPAILDSLKQRGRDVAAECEQMGAK